ncbi:hypothetical protein C7B65_10605 [Phormidesmis priestleyi ULC007]|uniref:Uncharacterized protein n=1 Tax=Phormidesmis priestleyi ULC007 TaxID=1920490 RepID=A0A2T1DH14_9CYAN|nr:hypothetical protein [Phormidesmis priestleyi]PSB19734.1 hypothetical protein C7B65_10605 [Phormidesmis priestleyi ULC007]PZO53618.1 MAG: hypothetical protein DCF14_04310 [Phormidesmis priestleyi]
MVSKKRAIDFAVKLGWTREDAKRAYESIGVNLDLVADDDEFTLALTLADYAGEVLSERQRKQAAQKAQVTKKTNEIEKIKITHAKKVEQYEEDLNLQRSQFVGIISRVYKIAQKIGLRDAWIEALLTSYNEYLQDEDDSSKTM